MKKLLSFCVMCLIALTMNAQRCAVLEFKAGSGISQADVDGISAIFITYFRPSGYTMVERTQIDRVIDEQGFQRSRLTESQMVRIGRILNVSKIVVGDVNVVMGQYNVDARVINVESGTIAATDGATFSGSSYRSSMQTIATRLASKIAIKPGPKVAPQSSASPSSTLSNTLSQVPEQRKRTGVEIVYGYLKVFPKELGKFDSEPTTVINQINAQSQYGYSNWRIPTNEELSLLRANDYLNKGTTYMTKENRTGVVLLVTDGKNDAAIQQDKCNQEKQGYVDLGLKSGTWWKKENERGYYTYRDADQKFRGKLPTKAQAEELLYQCSWRWDGNGYTITGPNGNTIFLAHSGYKTPEGTILKNMSSYYTCTFESGGGSYMWVLGFEPDRRKFMAGAPCTGNNLVRLVKKF